MSGEVNDCSCKVETVDLFNNNKVYPRLKSLLARDYFKYVRVNLKKGCPFWPEDGRCTVRDCHVNVCPQDKVPIKTRLEESDLKAQELKYSRESNKADEDVEESCATEKELSALDTTISDKKRADFQTWSQHDEALPMFCEFEDEDSSDLEYVDLLLNPDRYTGYKGSSAHRIWKSIYEEIFFKPENNYIDGQDLSKSYGADAFGEPTMCLEKRIFYNLISGLHTSINIHLSDNYHFSAGLGANIWDHNLKEFLSRFGPDQTNGQGPQRLKNLYFTYLIELRAIAKVTPKLIQEDFYTGDQARDAELKKGVISLLAVIKSFPDHFKENELFQANTKELRQLKVLGMGTALKIIFSADSIEKDNFRLTRSEIVVLFNAFGRLSSSIYAIETFRKLSGKTS